MAKKDPRYLSEIRTRISEGSETNNSLQTKLGEDWRITDMEGLTTQPRPNPKSLDLPLRYEPSVVLGIGGMGEVYRVFDRELQRYIAMKVIRSDLASRKLVRERFVEEAQICAQMQHPNIIPVYELGILPDGRDFFTMKEVDGTELSTLIGKVHAAASSGTWEPISNGWTFRRLIDNFVSVCEAVAHAHPAIEAGQRTDHGTNGSTGCLGDRAIEFHIGKHTLIVAFVDVVDGAAHGLSQEGRQ